MKKIVGLATMGVFILSLAGLAWARAKAEKALASPPAVEKLAAPAPVALEAPKPAKPEKKAKKARKKTREKAHEEKCQ